MRKKYKNQVFEILSRSKYGFDNFEIEERNSNGYLELVIRWKRSSFLFIIRNSKNDFDLFDCRFFMFKPHFPLSDYLPPAWSPFTDIIPFLSNWLESDLAKYAEDEEEIDLFEEYKKGNRILNFDSIDFKDRANFSKDEKTQIRLAINELKYLIHTTFQTSQEQQQLVTERLDYLVEASDRLNKFDWKSLVISTILSIATTLTLDTERGHQLFELFKKVFRIIPQLIM